ncbi:SDR family NAD(P)-dependent oxidoreductase [Pseudogemmobacter sonorensis]|uniref:SDR family NAD(P)-dependent oxidoreductase n=1 Tax=Pseudogemmobacter sonorensis TaxID=2989681 RepID=UPI00367501C6
MTASAHVSAGDLPLAIVTGAARSLGHDISRWLLQHGWRVAMTDADGDGVKAAAAAFASEGLPTQAWQLDVSDAHAVPVVFDAIQKAMGLPEALVNNAGIYPDHVLLDMRVEDWDRVIGINLRGTFLCTQAFGRQRRDAGVHGGAIVNFASAAAFSARPGVAHYSASKAAIVMFTKSCAQELGPLGIRVNAVAPGLIEVREGQVTPEYRDAYLTMIPRGRTGRAPDISGVVGFLLSPEADFVNAECIAVDGGFLAGRSLVRAGTL